MHMFTVTIPTTTTNVNVNVNVTPDMLEIHSIIEYAVYERALATVIANLPDNVSIAIPDDFDVFNFVKPA